MQKNKVVFSCVVFVFSFLMPMAVSAAKVQVSFNDGNLMTENGSFGASKSVQSGILIDLDGDPSGGTIDLEKLMPIGSWLKMTECSIEALPAMCRVAVGRGRLRITISGATTPSIQAIGYEITAVVVDPLVSVAAASLGPQVVFLQMLIGIESADVIPVEIQVLDSAGNPALETVAIDLELFTRFYEPVESSDFVFSLTGGGSGTGITPPGRFRFFATTDSAGALDVGITDVVGASAGMVLVRAAIGHRSGVTELVTGPVFISALVVFD